MADQEKPVSGAPLAKSYSVSGDTTEFNPWELQVHEISPELRQQISGLERPKLDPSSLEDTVPPQARGGYFAQQARSHLDGAGTVGETSSSGKTLRSSTHRAWGFLIAACRERLTLLAFAVTVLLGVAYLALVEVTPNSRNEEASGKEHHAQIAATQRPAAKRVATTHEQRPSVPLRRGVAASTSVEAEAATRTQPPLPQPVARSVSLTPKAPASSSRAVVNRGASSPHDSNPKPDTPAPAPDLERAPTSDPSPPPEVSSAPPVASSKSPFKFFLPPQ